MSEILAPKIDMQWIPPVVRPAQASDLKHPTRDTYKLDSLWVVAEDFVVTWFENGKYHKLIIKAGMLTDGASVPQLFWSTGFLPTGTNMGAAMVHDAAYAVKGKLSESKWLTVYTMDENSEWILEKDLVWSKAQCDHYFYQFMLQGGENKFKAWVEYQAVNLFGGPAWNKFPFTPSGDM